MPAAATNHVSRTRRMHRVRPLRPTSDRRQLRHALHVQAATALARPSLGAVRSAAGGVAGKLSLFGSLTASPPRSASSRRSSMSARMRSPNVGPDGTRLRSRLKARMARVAAPSRRTRPSSISPGLALRPRPMQNRARQRGGRKLPRRYLVWKLHDGRLDVRYRRDCVAKLSLRLGLNRDSVE
jgi:hypothetical protein